MKRSFQQRQFHFIAVVLSKGFKLEVGVKVLSYEVGIPTRPY